MGMSPDAINAAAGMAMGNYQPGPVPSNVVAPLKLTLMQRLWDRLGFGLRCPTPSSMEGDPRFAPGALMTVVKVELDWQTRLRILISGRVVAHTRTITDVPVNVAISRSTFSVGRPGEPL